MTTAVAGAASAAPQTSAEVSRARIAVMVSTYQVDVVVPTKFTVETFIDDLLAVLAHAINDDSVDYTPPNGQWSLARPGEQPIPRWRSLADHDVVDGTVLMLAAVESSEVFSPVVEDITDALALINEREFAEFDARTAAITGVSALGVGAVAAAVLLSWSWMRSGSMVWCALPALLLGLLCWGAGLAMRRNTDEPALCLGLVLSALPLLFAGGAMLVPAAYDEPGPFAAANIVAGATLTAVAAATTLRLTRVSTTVLTAVLVLGITVAVAAIPMAYLDVSLARTAGGAVFVGLILLTAAPRFSVVAARIRPPDLPDPGTEVAAATLTDIFDAETATADDPGPDRTEDDRRHSLRIEDRARLAVTSLRGLIVASSAVLSVSAVLAAAASPGGVREIVMGAAVAGILALRSRWYPDRIQAIALVAASAVTVAGVGWVLIGAYDTAVARLVVAAVVAALGVAACVAALRLPGRRLSPVTRRVIDLVEYALILVVPVLAFWIMGIYTAMRGI
ncbi:type VII secretion integral membrane protein EccD [Nocardia transvalensis]|uniref:Type VII secretion integral membrane protein EccD n=1 Tax=Nocardia transvalensis TaxID=37333 RepID=A0A7W9PMM0_9NOCA|nr:type VII secretion integral membrane protein EccD [Nocardia transvalensis]MBB5918745.1 type VII secretion integral membrane protein EccD [Nocardia transvalensis]